MSELHKMSIFKGYLNLFRMSTVYLSCILKLLFITLGELHKMWD